MTERPHKKLEVYKKSILMLKLVYQTANLLPSDEKFGLISQIKRAAISVPVNIAEGAARQTGKEFKQFLYISSGSLSELESLFEITYELEFIDKETYNNLQNTFREISAMLSGLIRSINKNTT
ncbi:MAG: four helix bundle protein [Bacteroidales bacterium]|nr:four helix bundle protein [Bacteroidales bacterium]MBN2819119.1 four helix bundle protein [Bacteroidales bacterium]